MKTRESGMPDEPMWSSFFSPREWLVKLGLTAHCRDVLDLGCGYGTFTIPAASIASGVVHALDIDPEMVRTTARKAEEAGLSNVRVEERDFVVEGTGLPDAGVDYVMIFNILHCEQPLILLREAHTVLPLSGMLSIVHWNYDPTTPRGPSMEIRPRPEQCRAWAEEVGFRSQGNMIDLPPYHYGWVLKKVEVVPSTSPESLV